MSAFDIYPLRKNNYYGGIKSNYNSDDSIYDYYDNSSDFNPNNPNEQNNPVTMGDYVNNEKPKKDNDNNSKPKKKKDKKKKKNKKDKTTIVTEGIYDATYVRTEADDIHGNLEFYLPKYGYADYINTLSSWQKQLRDINGEIGWFYFKLFFKFNTGYGLLGAIEPTIIPVNCALSYLESISNDSFQYKSCKIKDRINALYKFGNTLKHISLDVPWYFKGISGLASLKYPYTSEFQKEKSICIECSEESIDMRLGTLIDLYKFACFDSVNSREIIPANLRKFEMTLILMHVPLKYHHEPTIYHSGFDKQDYREKSLNLNNKFSELASFKMFTFQNCEIDLDGMADLYGDVISNETPFNMGKNKIKIKYDRMFEHRMNEWNEFLLGDDGFYYNNEKPFNAYEDSDVFKLINAEGNDSLHRILLDKINSNHNLENSKLVSYSDYFLNKIYEGTIGTNINGLIGNIKTGAKNVANQWKGVGQNFAGAWNVWKNKN